MELRDLWFEPDGRQRLVNRLCFGVIGLGVVGLVVMGGLVLVPLALR